MAEYTYEKGRIEWQQDESGLTRVYQSTKKGEKLIEEFDNGMEDIHLLPFGNVFESVKNNSRPLCHVHNSIQHTVCINALFQSSEVIPAIADEYLEEKDSFLGIKGIEPMIENMYLSGRSYFEAGAPWAKQAREICVGLP